MESSEDDAGIATNASRPESAREKTIEETDAVKADSNVHQISSEAGSSCDTPVMSEDNFDGDSVPSPSTHDPNTSTEAILDMIDELVDGPGAPRRLPREPDPPDCAPDAPLLPSETAVEEVKNEDHIESETLPEASNKPPLESPENIPTECPTTTTDKQSDGNVVSPQSEILSEANITEKPSENICDSETLDRPPESSSGAESVLVTPSVPEIEEPVVTFSEPASSSSVVQEEESVVETSSSVYQSDSSVNVTPSIESNSSIQDQPASSVECEIPSSCPLPNLPSSSNTDCKDNFNSEVSERTLKIVTTSDECGSVSVETVEPTSSEVSSEEQNRLSVGHSSDRPSRPDSTVTSTVDLQVSEFPESSTSDSLVKSVSSSSDINAESNQTVNESDVSECNTETLKSTPNKIKLVNKQSAPKSPSGTNINETVLQPCQSTSAIPEYNSEMSPKAVLPESSCENTSPPNCITTTPIVNENVEECPSNESSSVACSSEKVTEDVSTDLRNASAQGSIDETIDQRKVPPIKLINLTSNTCRDADDQDQSSKTTDVANSVTESVKQVPKLTIKLGNKPVEDSKSVVPKLTIKPLKPPDDIQKSNKEPIPSLKLNIKQFQKPADKVNDIHRKSSSSDISESESSENDESNSASDQASTSEQTVDDVVPKVTIKLGKPGTDSEGQFYTQQNIPKLTIKGLLNDTHEVEESPNKIKLKVNKTDDGSQYEKIPKLTIKPVTKSEGQPLSPKLTIKPIKPPENAEQSEIIKVKVSTESLSPKDVKDNLHVPKITIKPVTKSDSEGNMKSAKNVSKSLDNENIPIVTKLNIKPIPKPNETSSEITNCVDEKVPVISKLNIKPIIKPNEVDAGIDTVPKVTKLNIKPIRNPEECSLGNQETMERKDNKEENNIPVVTKLNIKPLVKPTDNSDNQSETENSSDENSEQIPFVTKLNIKPIINPNEADSSETNDLTENIPVVTRLNIKPVVKPEAVSSLSPKKELKSLDHKSSEYVPIVTKLNIKPIAKPDENELKSKDIEEALKNPPLVMKINIKSMTESSSNEVKQESVNLHASSNDTNEIATVPKITIRPVLKPKGDEHHIDSNCDSKFSPGKQHNELANPLLSGLLNQNCTKEVEKQNSVKDLIISKSENMSDHFETKREQKNCVASDLTTKSKYNDDKISKARSELCIDASTKQALEQLSQISQKSAAQTCTLLKKLLEDKPLNTTNIGLSSQMSENKINMINCENSNSVLETQKGVDVPKITSKEHDKHAIEPLEIKIPSDRSPSCGQDSPRIILKINKSEHGPCSELITEQPKNEIMQNNSYDDKMNDRVDKSMTNSRKKHLSNENTKTAMATRLRSSRVVPEADKPISPRKIPGKRPPAENILEQVKEAELPQSESKKAKLGKFLLNKALTITPVSTKDSNAIPVTPLDEDINTIQEKRTTDKIIDHTIHNDDNTNKNGNSKLHKILSNLHAAKHVQPIPVVETNCVEKAKIEEDSETTNSSAICSEVNAVPDVNSCSSPERVEITDDSFVSQDLPATPEMNARDPLETDRSSDPIPDMETPQPKKRGRPRKLATVDASKPVELPVPALEERPQRSLRLSRERPIPSPRTRGRGRGGRGAKRAADPPPPSPPPSVLGDKDELDPTSARVKLPRLSEALDNLPAEKGARGRGKSPRAGRARGRARGGGRGATYMKETLGIYGRVCGPATSTIQLFEEETCMMDDNASMAKSSHLLDEDSQSSVKSSTNDSSKLKRSKFADLFDSNKVWTAADVKEYKWPLYASDGVEPQVMMIQEQVAMFLNVKSFKRRYPELKRRAIAAEERDYVLSKGYVTEALCDLGITAVEAGDVLDIMLSDFPHKYEEYRSHQRERFLAGPVESPPKPSEVNVGKLDKFEFKPDMKPLDPIKPEPPKVDPEKLRQEMALAAIASASEWNSRLNASRRPACVDLQSLVIQRRRGAKEALPTGGPGLYPLALLPGQYQHHVRCYTPQQLRYFPLNTVLAAPPPPSDSSSESENDTSSDSSSDQSEMDRSRNAKRKKLSKSKRTSLVSAIIETPVEEAEVEVCRVCGVREEHNRQYVRPHDRFLRCSVCHANLHPACLELSADTIRKCREYEWQCPQCKACVACRRAAPPRMLFCDLCDRGFHAPCVGLDKAPAGRWHCTECALCKSCGARSPSGAGGTTGTPGSCSTPGTPGPSGTPGADGAEWHHQTKRGPSGNKVYSHSLCTPCARAYRIGRYCPLCDRSFIGPKGTMQLVICKLCDRQLHQECVRATVSNLNVLDYTCAECRRGGITSRAAAVRLAPRTIATLFMAKRRFNKYAHRQYLQSRMAETHEAEAEVEPTETTEVTDSTETHEAVDTPDVEPTDTTEVTDSTETPEASTPPTETPEDETANAVKALQMDFGD